MYLPNRILMIILAVSILVSPGIASARKSNGSSEMLKQSLLDLKKNPSDLALREKIIKLVQTMKPTPPIPEQAERHFVRGTVYFGKDSDKNDYNKKAIAEFEAASNLAPWMSLAYFNLGVAQEKEGLYAEALQSLKLFLLAAPDAKNAREVKNKIYALEVDVEDLKAGKAASQAAPQPSTSAAAPGKSLGIAGEPSLEVEPADKELKIVKMPPPEKKSRLPSFIGTWYFKESLRGEELTIEAFEIAKTPKGDLAIKPPKRAADSYATITQFEINDSKLKLQMRWKMRSVVGYWKTETYDLTISDDGKKMTGSHNQRSVGGRNIDMDRVLFRQ